MVTPHFILHIGAHKTGTTYLQRVFAALAPALRQQGVLYPDIWRPSANQPGHHRLPVRLRTASHAELARDVAEITDAGCPVVLLSAEDLGRLPPDRIAVLRSALGGAPLTIILHARRWSDALPSMWQEIIRHGQDTELPAYLAPLLANPAGALTTNWGHALRAWSGVFGRQNIRLVSFNHVIDAGLDPAEHFLRTFLPDRMPDLSAATALFGQPAHPSMPVWRIEIIRGLNALHAEQGGARGTAPRLWFLRALPTLDQDRLRQTIEPRLAELTLADSDPGLASLHDALLNTWEDRMVPPVQPGRLFTPGTRALPYLPNGAVAEPAVRSVLSDLYDAFRGAAANPRPITPRPSGMPTPLWHPESLAGRMPFLRRRGELTRATRAFLEARGYLEVETPYAVPAPGEEVHLRPFATSRTHPDGTTEPLWLHTSPEFAMKKLLVGGAGPIFQFARVWRNEEGSALHAPEFTMLEWYRPHADMDALIAETTDLLRAVLPPVVSCRGVTTDLSRIERLTVAEAFTRHAGADVLGTAGDAAALAASAGVGLRENETWEDLFFRLLLDRVEPAIGRTHPTFLTHWPADQAALARRDPDDPRVALRFELFVCGIELANAFVELTDAAEQRVRFEQDRARRHALYGPDWPMDEAFLAALAHGMPPSSGIALGFDRLAMLATGADRIGQVLWLPPPDLA